MKRYLTTVLLGVSITVCGASNDSLYRLASQSGIVSRIKSESCDTAVDVDGYRVRIIKRNGEFSHIGLDLFSPEMKDGADKRQLDFIETALFARSLQTETGNSQLLTITAGNIRSFKDITPASECNVSYIDSKRMTAVWNLDGKVVAVSLPVNYDVIRSGSRSEIEQDFIDAVKEGGLKRAAFDEVDMENIEPYGDELYVLPGGAYLKRNINRNVFFSDSNLLKPVWSSEYPLESLANLVLYPSDTYSDPQVDFTVIRHEYGEKEAFIRPLSHLLAAAEAEGCMAFWGTEKFEEGKLEGSIFLYNRHQGYDHVLKIECDPIAVINGSGIIRARGSLYVPTNNVRDLYVPYVKKSEDEKIKYKD